MRCEDGELHKNIAKQTRVYVGVNNKVIEDRMKEGSKFRKQHEMRVEQIIKRERWEGNPKIE